MDNIKIVTRAFTPTKHIVHGVCNTFITQHTSQNRVGRHLKGLQKNSCNCYPQVDSLAIGKTLSVLVSRFALQCLPNHGDSIIATTVASLVILPKKPNPTNFTVPNDQEASPTPQQQHLLPPQPSRDIHLVPCRQVTTITTCHRKRWITHLLSCIQWP